jgi:hypothetical protein
MPDIRAATNKYTLVFIDSVTKDDLAVADSFPFLPKVGEIVTIYDSDAAEMPICGGKVESIEWSILPSSFMVFIKVLQDKSNA